MLPARNNRTTHLLFGLLLALVLLLAGILIANPTVRSLFGAAGAPLLTCDKIGQIPLAECQALQSLYDATNGPQWTKGATWFKSETPCEWTGLVCDETQTHVTSLYLHSNRMQGALPEAISGLSHLEQLSAGRNALSGPLPAALGGLTHLTLLELSENQITGTLETLPAALETLNLAYNQLEGPVPGSLGDVSGLQELNLGFNRFSGPIPTTLGQLSGLRKLWLAGNQLSGPIPTELAGLAALTELHLEGNQLEGELPAGLGGLAALEGLFVQDNRLSGPLPNELGGLSGLKSLAIGSNAFSGPIPESYAQLSDLGTEATDLVDLGYNGLFTSNPALQARLEQVSPAWRSSQTLAPAGLVAYKSEQDILLTWTPIEYTGDGGYYEVSYAALPDGEFQVLGHTSDKSTAEYLVQGLDPDKTYAFRVRTTTPPHDGQKNELWSDFITIPDVLYKNLAELPAAPEWQNAIFLPIMRK